MLFTKLHNCLKGGISNTLHYIHTLETHYRQGLKMVRIRNGNVLARKLSVSEGWYLFAEVFSRNLQFGFRWKYQSRLFGYRKHVVYTSFVKMIKATHTELQREMINATCEVRRMLLRGKIFSQISWDISYLWIKFIKSWIRNLSTAVFFFDSSHKIFHSINRVTHLTDAYSELSQTSQMRLFAKLFLSLAIFA